MAVGATGRSMAKVFRFDPSTGRWEQLGQTLSGALGFGFFVSLSGDGLTVSVSGGSKWKNAAVYGLTEINTTYGITYEWTKLGQDIRGGTYADLSVDGRTIAVGGDYVSGTYASINTFNTTTNLWIQRFGIGTPNEAACSAISADGSRVFFGMASGLIFLPLIISPR
jgi:hypothetical protein